MTGARKYGLSTVWVSPSQARVPSMEEVVGKTDHQHLQWTQLALCLGVVTWGTCHVPLPKEGHLGILPQRGAEVTPCR